MPPLKEPPEIKRIYSQAYLWDDSLWSGMMKEGLEQLNVKCKRKEAEEDILGGNASKGKDNDDDGDYDDIQDGFGNMEDELLGKRPKGKTRSNKPQAPKGNMAFEVALGIIGRLTAMLQVLPTNFDDVDVPRSPAQLTAQELLLSSMIPGILGHLYKSVSYLLADYFVMDFEIPLQVVILSRRSGKSTLIAMLLLIILWECPGFPIIVMAKFLEQADIILDTVKVMAQYSFPGSKRWVFTKGRIVCLHPGRAPSTVITKASNVKVIAILFLFLPLKPSLPLK